MVQRPQLGEKDSVETTLSLLLKGEREPSIYMNKRNIQSLARAYTTKKIKYPYFHGI